MTRARKHASGIPLRLVKPPKGLAVLGIDPGHSSGAGLIIDDKLKWAYQVPDHAATRREIMGLAVAMATGEGALLVVVVEKSQNYGSNRVVRGIGEAAGRWKEQAELAGVPKRRIITVQVNEWREAIYGSAATRLGKDGHKANAVQLCRAKYGLELGEDAAEAALIAEWGMRAPEVMELLPKRRNRGV